jgi:hypothetical protein
LDVWVRLARWVVQPLDVGVQLAISVDKMMGG